MLFTRASFRRLAFLGPEDLVYDVNVIHLVGLVVNHFRTVACWVSDFQELNEFTLLLILVGLLPFFDLCLALLGMLIQLLFGHLFVQFKA